MFCLTLFEGLLFLGKQKVVSSHFFHNWLLFVCLWQKCTCSLYGTVVLQFVLNEMGWSILRISAGLDLNHARWHVSIRDNKLIHTSHNLCGSVPISGLNIIKTFMIENMRDRDEVRGQRTETLLVFLGWCWARSLIPCDPCTDEPLPYYIGRTPEPRIISCHQSDYPHMPHHGQWPVIPPVIQSNHFTPEQHFDASEDYGTTTGSAVKLSPGLMFQRGYLSMSETNLRMAKPLESGHLEISSVSSLEAQTSWVKFYLLWRIFKCL